MSEPWAYYQGQWLPWSQVQIPLDDAGFTWGVSASEQLRTYRGQLFGWSAHWQRWSRSVEILGCALPWEERQAEAIAQELVTRYLPDAPGGDMGLSLVFTPGPLAAWTAGPRAATALLHVYPLAYQRWAAQYRRGSRLTCSRVRQVPAECWPAEFKGRSRLHYYLADQDVAQRAPGSRALLLSLEGFLRETSTANLILCCESAHGPRLLSPPRSQILPGVSLDVTRELATSLGARWEERELSRTDLEQADEVWLTSTPWAILPVIQVDDRPVGSGAPGPRFAELLAAWQIHTGCNFVQQAQEAVAATFP